MVIYSWNMFFRNQRLDEAFDFIRDSDSDVFCLQEVPEEFLERLRTLPYSIAAAPEADREHAGTRSTQYAVILSRFRIEREGRIALAGGAPAALRSRLFLSFMARMRIFAHVRGNRHSLYADVATPGGTVRIYDLHLPLTHPAQRIEEFERALAERDTAVPAIVCGDFNTIESPKVSALNWLIGGRLSDALRYRRERTRIERRFVEHELQNPLRGTSTHPLSRSQLDHILVSHSLSIKSASVLPGRLGSDHHPIRVETA